MKRPVGGKLSAAQEVFLESVRDRGGVAVVVADIAVLSRVLDRLEREPDCRFTIWGEPT